jgi:hypothetical protein
MSLKKRYPAERQSATQRHIDPPRSRASALIQRLADRQEVSYLVHHQGAALNGWVV